MIDKIKKTRYNVGDRVWVNPQESEYGPFEAVIFKVERPFRNGYIGEPEYGILEIIGNTLYGEEKLANPSDSWPENMLSLSYPR